MPALDKQCTLFIVVVGRAAGTVGRLLVCRTHRSPLKSLAGGAQQDSKKGVVHSEGSPTEARNADLVTWLTFPNSPLETEKTSITELNTSLLLRCSEQSPRLGQSRKAFLMHGSHQKCGANLLSQHLDFHLQDHVASAYFNKNHCGRQCKKNFNRLACLYKIRHCRDITNRISKEVFTHMVKVQPQ